MLRIRRKLIAEKYSTFNERLDQALCCAPMRRRHCDLIDRSKPLLSGRDSVWRRATIHGKRDAMMSEWKNRLINWRSLKTRRPQAVNDERRQDPHSAPSVLRLFQQDAATPN